MTSTRPIRALLRGLDVLYILNQHDGSTVSEVATAIGLPRTTTYRILETFCQAGYAYRAGSDERYRLTIMVRGLADGFDDEAWVTQIARPYMYELCNEIVWPVAIATLSGSTMLIRQTTDHLSPLAVEKRGSGFRVAILGSASGIAYLSWCPNNQQQLLLEVLGKSTASDDEIAASPIKIQRLLSETRTRGYAMWRRSRRVSDEISLSVPILANDRLLASLTVRFSSTALQEDDAIRRFIPKMQSFSERIGADFLFQSERQSLTISPDQSSLGH